MNTNNVYDRECINQILTSLKSGLFYSKKIALLIETIEKSDLKINLLDLQQLKIANRLVQLELNNTILDESPLFNLDFCWENFTDDVINDADLETFTWVNEWIDECQKVSE